MTYKISLLQMDKKAKEALSKGRKYSLEEMKSQAQNLSKNSQVEKKKRVN